MVVFGHFGHFGHLAVLAVLAVFGHFGHLAVLGHFAGLVGSAAFFDRTPKIPISPRKPWGN